MARDDVESTFLQLTVGVGVQIDAVNSYGYNQGRTLCKLPCLWHLESRRSIRDAMRVLLIVPPLHTLTTVLCDQLSRCSIARQQLSGSQTERKASTHD